MVKAKPEGSWIEELSAVVARRPVVLEEPLDEEPHGRKEPVHWLLSCWG